jgi:hypothetical protein
MRPQHDRRRFGKSATSARPAITLGGRLEMTGLKPVVAVTDGLTLDGTIELGSTSNSHSNDLGRLDFQSARALAGRGSIAFGEFDNKPIDTANRNGDSGALAVRPHIAIHGQSGSIGSDNNGRRESIRRVRNDLSFVASAA